jgi:hypothetical protein
MPARLFIIVTLLTVVLPLPGGIDIFIIALPMVDSIAAMSDPRLGGAPHLMGCAAIAACRTRVGRR